jgi:hypothetical protein
MKERQMPITSYPLVDEPRDRFLRVRLSPREYDALQRAANARGVPLSEESRERLFTTAPTTRRNPFAVPSELTITVPQR